MRRKNYILVAVVLAVYAGAFLWGNAEPDEVAPDPFPRYKIDNLSVCLPRPLNKNPQNLHSGKELDKLKASNGYFAKFGQTFITLDYVHRKSNNATMVDLKGMEKNLAGRGIEKFAYKETKSPVKSAESKRWDMYYLEHGRPRIRIMILVNRGKESWNIQIFGPGKQHKEIESTAKKIIESIKLENS